VAGRRRLPTITEAQGTCVNAQVRGTICTLTSTQMPLGPGTRLGPYEILSALGAGGMGEVYKARDTRLDRTVAIKVLPAQFAADPEFRERFEREAKAISQLTHPHICTLYDVGSQDGTDFLVMEYLEGETLADRLAKGALSLEQALQVGIQIADALAKAHRAGVVHRDLKPGNIMVTKTGGKLLDFGLAKTSASVGASAGISMLPTTPHNLTAQGTILGTFQYMAPEQLEGQEADTRTDIFAFGAVLYETLTGKKAFEGKSQASLIAAILEREPPAISSVQPLSPPILDRVVRKCLAKNPDDRWQTATDLLDELRWVTEASYTASATVSATTRFQSRRLALVSAVAVALLLTSVVLTGVILLHRETTSLGTIRLAVFPPEKATFSVQTGRPEFAVSPDGRLITFSATDIAGKTLLWVQPFDSFTAQPMTETAGATSPFWSPDGRYIGFFAQGKLKKVEVSGGVPQTLCDAAAGEGGTWNRDGLILFSPRNGSVLFRVSDAGGDATAVTALNPSRQEVSHLWPQFLPDGRHFIYLAQSRVAENGGIFLGSIDDEQTKLLVRSDVRAAYASGYLIFARITPGSATLMAQPFDTRRLTFTSEPVRVTEQLGGGGIGGNASGAAAFAVSESGVLAFRTARRGGDTQFVWLDRRGKPLEPVGQPSIYRTHELSPDEERIATHRHEQRRKHLDHRAGAGHHHAFHVHGLARYCANLVA
jgi:serine/threonine protein kinase